MQFRLDVDPDAIVVVPLAHRVQLVDQGIVVFPAEVHVPRAHAEQLLLKRPAGQIVTAAGAGGQEQV